MDTIGTARSTQINPTAAHQGVEIRASTPPGNVHETVVLDPHTAAMKAHLNSHLTRYRVEEGVQNAEELNREMEQICNARMAWLLDTADGKEREDMTSIRNVERTAERLDLFFNVVKFNIGGWPFAASTIGTNENPQVLEIFSRPKSNAAHDALVNAVASVFASVADATGNHLLSGFKPGQYQKPPDDELHSAIQASVAGKRLSLDKGILGNAFHEGLKWLIGFLARNFAVYPMTVVLTHYNQAQLAARIEHILRPISAVLVGVTIGLYTEHQDKKHGLAGLAMLYGRRDAPLANGERRPIAEEEEWKRNYLALKELNASGMLDMIPKRAGQGVATLLKSLVSGEALQANFTAANLGGAAALAGGFALMSYLTTQTQELTERHNLSQLQAALAVEAVKNVLGAFAFFFWAIGAYLGESLSKKAAHAVDSHVANGVENGLYATGRISLKGVKATKQMTAKLTKKTGQELGNATSATSSAVTRGRDSANQFFSRHQQRLSTHYHDLMYSETTAGPASTSTGALAPTSSEQAIPLTPLPNQNLTSGAASQNSNDSAWSLSLPIQNPDDMV